MEEVKFSPEFLREMANKAAEIKHKRMFPSPELFNFRLGEATCRIIWNRMFTRPKDEHLHEFMFHAMGWVLGEHWIQEQMKKPLEERHVIMTWTQARFDFLTKLQEQGVKIGEKVIPTGEVRELISLASDMYYLQLVDELPKNLVKRLKSYDGFQGARYEIAVASSLIRGGFTIKWTNAHKSQTKIYEFDAFQSYTKETIAIEAKSRKRDGTLHYEGDFPNFEEIKLDIFSLYNKAIKQNPNDKPFGIFIDINLPRLTNQEKGWKELMLEKLGKEGISIFGSNVPTFLAITNCAWHYDGDNTATNEEYLILFPEPQFVKFPIEHEITLQTILRTMNLFSKIPEDKLK